MLALVKRFMLGDVQRFIGSLVESRRPSGARLVLAGVIGGAAKTALADEMQHCPRPKVGIVAKSRSRVQFRIVISRCEFRRRKDCQTLAVFDEERRRHNDSHRSQLRPSSMAVRAPAIRRPIQVVYDTDQADVCTEDWALSSWN